LRAATAALGIATAELYPRITLSAINRKQSLETNTFINASNRVWNLIGGITAPLFDGGTLRAKARATLHALDARAARISKLYCRLSASRRCDGSAQSTTLNR